MNCLYCETNIVDGVIRSDFIYCSEEHADLDWREKWADVFAYNETGGQLTNFEELHASLV